MSPAFAGFASRVGEESSDGCRRRFRENAKRCNEFFRQDIGLVPDTLMAHSEGPKNKRFHAGRHSLLTTSGFDPIATSTTG